MTFHLLSNASISQIERQRPTAFWLTLACAAAFVACGAGPEPTNVKPPESAAQEAAEEAAIPTRPTAEGTQQTPAARSENPGESKPAEASHVERSSPPASSQVGAVDYNDTVWAPGQKGVLMKGLDGGLYEPYLSSTVKHAQRELKPDFYTGPVTGVLDEATMHAIGEFQKKNDLHVSGVPSPYTRERLDQEADANTG